MEVGAKSTSSVEASCEFKALPLVCALDVLTSRQQVGAGTSGAEKLSQTKCIKSGA